MSPHRMNARITPARAGKRFKAALFAVLLNDHPRTRGEKVRRDGVIVKDLGSPPHARGKGNPVPVIPEDVRITPARAGKSFARYGALFGMRDHPRTRGEKRNVL